MEPIMTYRVKVANLTLTVLFQTPTSDPLLKAMIHSHYYTEVFFCLKGSFSVLTLKGEVTIAEGEMITVPAELRHHTVLGSPDSSAGAFGLTAEPCGTGGEPDLYGVVAPLLTEPFLRVYRGTGSFFPLLNSCVTDPKDLNNVFTACSFLQALTTLPHRDYPVSPPSGADAMPEREMLRLVRFHELISRQFMRELPLSEVAEELFLSERQVERFVRKHYGKSVLQVILDKRTEAAAARLLSSDDPADRIGQRVGFRSPGGFSSHFKARYGVTPAEYRRLARSCPDEAAGPKSFPMK